MWSCLIRLPCLGPSIDPELQPLNTDYPPPSTILTAPRPRPPPLSGLTPHERLRSPPKTADTATNGGEGYGSASPHTTTEGETGESGVNAGVGRDLERMGGISRFYSQRMLPLTRPSLPSTPYTESSPPPTSQDTSRTHRRAHTHTSYPTTPDLSTIPNPARESRTVPTSPTVPLQHTLIAPHLPSSPPPPPPPPMSRSISAPLHLSAQLTALRSLRPRTVISTPEIEGFAAHQLPSGLATDPRSVMIYRGRPRSATTLTADRTGYGVMRSVSDDVLRQGSRRGSQDGLEWTGRRGRSPGPTRIGISRRTTGEGSQSPRFLSSRTGSGRPTRESSLNMSIDGNEGRNQMDREEGEGEEEETVVKKEMGLKEMFGASGSRQSRSATTGGRRGGGRGSTNRPRRGRRIMTG